jgi:putative FmdB family regulatory protein
MGKQPPRSYFMPTYDYVCDSCEHQFENFQSITSPVLKKCPACGKRKLRRLIGAGAAIVFKGSGFYETDYRSESYKKGAAAEKAGGSDGATAKPKTEKSNEKAEKSNEKAEKSSEKAEKSNEKAEKSNEKAEKSNEKGKKKD